MKWFWLGVITPFLIAAIACTVQFDPDTETCLVSFSPNGEQIRAIGEVCTGVLTKIHDEPTSVSIEEDGGV